MVFTVLRTSDSFSIEQRNSFFVYAYTYNILHDILFSLNAMRVFGKVLQ